MTARRGVTLAELIVALTAGGLVATAAVRLLSGTRRVHDHTLERAEALANLRAGLLILREQLEELSAGSSGDLVAFGPTSVTFRDARGLFQTCRPAAPGALVLEDPPLVGHRWFDPAEHELIVRVPATSGWTSVVPTGLAPDTTCPGGAPARRVPLAGPAPPVPAGAPVRVVRRREVRLYQGGDGAWWIGEREWVRSAGTWSTVQPLLGPVDPAGLLFTWLARDGSETTVPARVARVQVTLTAIDAGGRPATAAFAVALRNGTPLP